MGMLLPNRSEWCFVLLGLIEFEGTAYAPQHLVHAAPSSVSGRLRVHPCLFHTSAPAPHRLHDCQEVLLIQYEVLQSVATEHVVMQAQQSGNDWNLPSKLRNGRVCVGTKVVLSCVNNTTGLRLH